VIIQAAESIVGCQPDSPAESNHPETAASPKGHRRSTPKWEAEAQGRLRSAIKKYSKHLVELVERDANEADTRILVTEILCGGLGYDRFNDLGTEYLVKGDFADYLLRVDGDRVCFVEVKRCSTKLGTRHLKQVENYALHDGVEWIILTNGAKWQLHHLEPGLPIDVALIREVDLLDGRSAATLAAEMFLLTKEAMKHNLLEVEWRSLRATSPKALGSAILSEPVVRAVRAQLRKATGHLATMDEIARLLRETVLKADACGD